MLINQSHRISEKIIKWTTVIAGVLVIALACPVNIFSVNPLKPVKPQRRGTSPVTEMPDTISQKQPGLSHQEVWFEGDTVNMMPADSASVVLVKETRRNSITDSVYTFNPNPTRAVWLSALFPGLGQLYNRRYWKLPIIIGGFMGLGYATSWNNGMLRDYTRAYSDILDNDPSTRSYMDFFPPTTKEEDLNVTWLANTFKSRKDYYRRNRDLCIICMVGVYLLAMVDAYVDASMAHFDISPSLSMDVAPAFIPESRDKLPGVGLQWALTF